MDLRSLYPPRPDESRKGDFGRVLVAGGSERYAGAPAFNALAALRAGADLALVVAPRRAADIVASYAPDLITIPCDAPFPEPRVVRATDADALVLGGGVERSAVAHKALREMVANATKPAVLDAEALHAVAPEPALTRGKPFLLTPHGGEYKVLMGQDWPADRKARPEAARALAEKFGCAVIVKGRWDVISDGRQSVEDPRGSSFLTKGGYGDLVAGAAGALLARGRSPFDAAVGAAWIVGRAGELAAAEMGESTIASDALARFPQAVSERAR